MDIIKKARNYFVLAGIAESLNMISEATSNYLKALFAVDDYSIFNITKNLPRDHSERFEMLKANLPKLYEITDKLFSVYRRTYTKEIVKEELVRVKIKVMEAFKNANIKTPTDEEIRKKFEELTRKGKIFS